MARRKRTISATLEEHFVRKLDEAAQVRGVSRSHLLEECITTGQFGHGRSDFEAGGVLLFGPERRLQFI